MVKNRILNDPVTYPEKFGENARSICEGLLVKEVERRLGFRNGSCDELRAHPFFSEINWRKLNAGRFQTETHVVSSWSPVGSSVQLLYKSTVWSNNQKNSFNMTQQH